MHIRLHLPQDIKSASLQISGSKSETNRLLLLQALYPGIIINNPSHSDDSNVMQKALSGNEVVVDIHHAGTAMRFLTAYYAIQEGREVVLTGSVRMKERPISVLVDALRSLGAQIEYAQQEGFPPLKIIGKKLTGSSVTLKADVSSQYITALLLIAGSMENGLEITLEGEITSRPYIEMTLALLNEIDIETDFSGNIITVKPNFQNLITKTITVESDWSSASYFYSIAALAKEGTSITLSSYKNDSLQGDSALVEIYKQLGVMTKFDSGSITLTKSGLHPSTVNCQLNNTPDIAQTIAVTCLGLGIECHLSGLHTLKIKETDRLEALKAEMEKLGAEVEISGDSLTLKPLKDIVSNTEIATYNDHRMAMAFAPLAIKAPIIIKDAGVVSKSYPAFWSDLEKLGFSVNSQ